MLGQNIGRVGLPDMSAGGRPSMTLDFVGIPVLNEKVTFSRTSGATWFNSAGVLQGVDFSVTSNTIGTGSKTFTLDATAGVNRYWAAGDTVLISDQSNSANNMVGTVTSYTASTQVLVVNVTSTGGSGTIASWRIGSTMPRFDYNPATLAARGLLIEEQRTNSIRNNTMQGAVAGTPGTAPTNWTLSGLSGLTQQIVGTGTESGISYIDIRIFGTTTSGMFYGIAAESVSSVAATPNSIWTNSWYVKLVGGSTAGLSAIKLVLTNFNASAVPLNQFLVTTIVPTSAALNTQRFSQTSLSTTFSDATTAFIRPILQLEAPNGAAIDITLRIGLPQLELGAFATSVIPTTTTALTRSADVASVNTLSPWFNASAGTLFAEYIATNSAQNNSAASLSDNTNDNRMLIRATNSSAQTVFIGVASTVTQWNDIIATALLNTPTKSAFGYATNDIAWVRNGGTVGTDTTATIPTVNRLQLGLDGAGTLPLNGYLRRITYYPRKLSAAELQTITA